MPPIRFRCIRCQHAVQAPEKAAGKKMYCPVCYFQLTVPSESTVKPIDPSKLYAADTTPIDVREMRDRLNYTSLRCNICHTNISVSKELIGREIECPECGTKIVVPEDIGHKIDAATEDKLDRIMLGLAATSQKDVYGVRGGGADSTQDDWSKRFPVHCRLCGTILYAMKDQVGRELTCPDCETKTIVPPPPKQAPEKSESAFSFEGGTTFGVAGDAPEVLDGSGMLVPVVCKLCGTRMYARESEIGGFKICPDCETRNEIKAVPKEMMSSCEEVSGDGYDVDAGKDPGERPMFRTMTDYRVVEGSLDKEVWEQRKRSERGAERASDVFGVEAPLERSAESTDRTTDLLAGEWADRLLPEARTPEEKKRECERKRKTIYEKIEEVESKIRNDERLPLPARPFWTKVFVPFRDAKVLFRIMLAAFVFIMGILTGTVFGPGVATVVLMIAFAIIANTGYSIFLWTAAGGDLPDHDDWFDLGVAGTAGYGLWLVFVIALAAMPGLMFGRMLSANPVPAHGIDPIFSASAYAREDTPSPIENIVRYAQTADDIEMESGGTVHEPKQSGIDIMQRSIDFLLGTFSCWIFFPILFLSSMENDSWYALIGRGTWTSLVYETSAWVKFYAVTFLLGLILIGLPALLELLVLLTGDMLGGVIIIPNMIALIFFPLMYFRFLGRLAWVLEELSRQTRES